MAAHQAWDVFQNRKKIDTVFFDPTIPADEVKQSLVGHDGYDASITVRRPRRLTRLAEVNKALQARGDRERLRKGQDYYYFSGGTASLWPTSGVYAVHADDLSVGQWLAEHNRLKSARVP